jgi:hypothetical protein
MDKSSAERKPSKIFFKKFNNYFGTNGQIHCRKETFQDYFLIF